MHSHTLLTLLASTSLVLSASVPRDLHPVIVPRADARAVTAAAAGKPKPSSDPNGCSSSGGNGSGNNNGNTGEQKCGNGQIIACCDGEQDPTKGGVDSNTCQQAGLFSIIGGLLQQNCGNSAAFCCEQNQSGFINIRLPCIPLVFGL